MKGIAVHVWDQDQSGFNATTYFDLIKKAGAEWISLDVVNPYSVDYDVPRFNLFLNQAHARGIKVLGIIDQLTMGQQSTFSLADWVTTVTTAKSLFSSVDAWQIWNEPNAGVTRMGYMDGSAQHYFDMVQAAYPILHPTPVIAGSLSDYTASDTNNTAMVAFASALAQLGISAYCEYWGIHFYSLNEAAWVVPAVQSIFTSKALWVTEVGVSSYNIGVQAQANEFNDLENFLKSNGLGLAQWYDFIDYVAAGASSNAEDYFGLVDVNFNLKQVYNNFQAANLTPGTNTLVYVVIGGSIFVAAIVVLRLLHVF